MLAISSTTPAAAIMCPSIDLIELIGTRRAWSLKTCFTEAVSIESLSGVDVPGASSSGMFQLFQNQDSGTLRKNKTIAFLVKRTGGPFGLDISRGKRRQKIESRHTQWVDHRVR